MDRLDFLAYPIKTFAVLYYSYSSYKDQKSQPIFATFINIKTSTNIYNNTINAAEEHQTGRAEKDNFTTVCPMNKYIP